MKLTVEEKLSMCKEHIDEKKSLSHISERYGGYNISGIKYLINLYKKHGEGPFHHRERMVYQRNTKLLLIKRVKKWRINTSGFG